MLEAGRNHYILVLIRALEKRAENGDIDAALADHIERLLGVGKPDPAGEAEYASWTPSAMAHAPRYRHIGYAKYVPTTDGGSLLVCCGPDESGAFRMFREPRTDGVPTCDGKGLGAGDADGS